MLSPHIRLRNSKRSIIKILKKIICGAKGAKNRPFVFGNNVLHNSWYLCLVSNFLVSTYSERVSKYKNVYIARIFKVSFIGLNSSPQQPNFTGGLTEKSCQEKLQHVFSYPELSPVDG